MKTSAYIGLTLNVTRYNNSRPINQLKIALDELYFGTNHKPHQWFMTANGRSAIYVFLKSLNLPPGSEILVQSFTCVTAINPVLWAGLVPIYVDIDPNTLSASLESLQKHITPQTKVIMLQHTFGLPAASKAVQTLAKKHQLILLEDCAHALAATDASQALGTFGDAAIISFGIEKTLPTKLGGALVVNNPDLIQAVESTYQKLSDLPRRHSFLWLIYPAIRQLLRNTPPSLSTPLRQLLEYCGLLKQSVVKSEYSSVIPTCTLAKLPGVHAKVILDALSSLDYNLNHRRMLSQLYYDKLADSKSLKVLDQSAAFIKFPLICQSTKLRDYLIETLAQNRIYVTNWYSPAIYPAGVDYFKLNYQPSACPQSESTASCILNLPTGTNITEAHATMIANEVNLATAEFSRGAESVSSST